MPGLCPFLSPFGSPLTEIQREIIYLGVLCEHPTRFWCPKSGSSRGFDMKHRCSTANLRTHATTSNLYARIVIFLIFLRFAPVFHTLLLFLWRIITICQPIMVILFVTKVTLVGLAALGTAHAVNDMAGNTAVGAINGECFLRFEGHHGVYIKSTRLPRQ